LNAEWYEQEAQLLQRNRVMLCVIEYFTKSLKVTFYWSAIVSIALSCTIFEFIDVE